MHLEHSSVAIVGSSLTGYMTAAVLADAGCRNITVFDAMPDPTIYEVGRPYSQVIYQTGQRLLRKLPSLDRTFKDEAYCQYVRTVTDLSADGRVSVSATKPPAGPLYWILKSHMLSVLDAHVRKEHGDAVTVRFGCRVEDIVIPDKAGTQATLVVTESCGSDGDESPKTEKLQFDVLFACDGYKSVMRKLMAVHEPRVRSTNGLGLYTRDVASTGIRVQGLTLSERPVVSAPGKPVELAMPSMIYSIRGERRGRPHTEVFDMLMLPVSGGYSTPRRVAISLQDGHKLLSVTSVDECFQIFRENFPQLDVDQLVSRDEMEKFVSTPAAHFPAVQRPMSLAAYFGTGGMAFVGDSAHSFPTDTAQGINSAFQDVEALLDVLRDEANPAASWADVLSRYEKARDAETWALINMVGIGSPYQYGQNKVAATAHAVNRSIRGLISALIPGMPCTDIDTLIRQDLSYRKVRTLHRVGGVAMAALASALVVIPVVVMKGQTSNDGEKQRVFEIVNGRPKNCLWAHFGRKPKVLEEGFTPYKMKSEAKNNKVVYGATGTEISGAE